MSDYLRIHNLEALADYPKFLLVYSPGKAPTEVAEHSHYLNPLYTYGIRGESRVWGDIAVSKQYVIAALITSTLASHGLKIDEIAYALSMVRLESGFNPDAAAGSSSACGLAQFIDATRKALAARCGMSSVELFKFDAIRNCILLTEHLYECFTWAKGEEGNKWILAYKYHHDGPYKDYGGAELAEKYILPMMNTAKAFAESILRIPDTPGH